MTDSPLPNGNKKKRSRKISSAYTKKSTIATNTESDPELFKVQKRIPRDASDHNIPKKPYPKGNTYEVITEKICSQIVNFEDFNHVTLSSSDDSIKLPRCRRQTGTFVDFLLKNKPNEKNPPNVKNCKVMVASGSKSSIPSVSDYCQESCRGNEKTFTRLARREKMYRCPVSKDKTNHIPSTDLSRNDNEEDNSSTTTSTPLYTNKEGAKGTFKGNKCSDGHQRGGATLCHTCKSILGISEATSSNEPIENTSLEDFTAPNGRKVPNITEIINFEKTCSSCLLKIREQFLRSTSHLTDSKGVQAWTTKLDDIEAVTCSNLKEMVEKSESDSLSAHHAKTKLSWDQLNGSGRNQKWDELEEIKRRRDLKANIFEPLINSISKQKLVQNCGYFTQTAVDYKSKDRKQDTPGILAKDVVETYENFINEKASKESNYPNTNSYKVYERIIKTQNIGNANLPVESHPVQVDLFRTDLEAELDCNIKMFSDTKSEKQENEKSWLLENSANISSSSSCELANCIMWDNQSLRKSQKPKERKTQMERTFLQHNYTGYLSDTDSLSSGRDTAMDTRLKNDIDKINQDQCIFRNYKKIAAKISTMEIGTNNQPKKGKLKMNQDQCINKNDEEIASMSKNFTPQDDFKFTVFNKKANSNSSTEAYREKQTNKVLKSSAFEATPDQSSTLGSKSSPESCVSVEEGKDHLPQSLLSQKHPTLENLTPSLHKHSSNDCNTVPNLEIPQNIQDMLFAEMKSYARQLINECYANSKPPQNIKELISYDLFESETKSNSDFVILENTTREVKRTILHPMEQSFVKPPKSNLELSEAIEKQIFDKYCLDSTNLENMEQEVEVSILCPQEESYMKAKQSIFDCLEPEKEQILDDSGLKQRVTGKQKKKKSQNGKLTASLVNETTFQKPNKYSTQEKQNKRPRPDVKPIDESKMAPRSRHPDLKENQFRETNCQRQRDIRNQHLKISANTNISKFKGNSTSNQESNSKGNKQSKEQKPNITSNRNFEESPLRKTLTLKCNASKVCVTKWKTSKQYQRSIPHRKGKSKYEISKISAPGATQNSVPINPQKISSKSCCGKGQQRKPAVEAKCAIVKEMGRRNCGPHSINRKPDFNDNSSFADSSKRKQSAARDKKEIEDKTKEKEREEELNCSRDFSPADVEDVSIRSVHSGLETCCETERPRSPEDGEVSSLRKNKTPDSDCGLPTVKPKSFQRIQFDANVPGVKRKSSKTHQHLVHRRKPRETQRSKVVTDLCSVVSSESLSLGNVVQLEIKRSSNSKINCSEENINTQRPCSPENIFNEKDTTFPTSNKHNEDNGYKLLQCSQPHSHEKALISEYECNKRILNQNVTNEPSGRLFSDYVVCTRKEKQTTKTEYVSQEVTSKELKISVKRTTSSRKDHHSITKTNNYEKLQENNLLWHNSKTDLEEHSKLILSVKGGTIEKTGMPRKKKHSNRTAKYKKSIQDCTPSSISFGKIRKHYRKNVKERKRSDRVLKNSSETLTKTKSPIQDNCMSFNSIIIDDNDVNEGVLKQTNDGEQIFGSQSSSSIVTLEKYKLICQKSEEREESEVMVIYQRNLPFEERENAEESIEDYYDQNVHSDNRERERDIKEKLLFDMESSILIRVTDLETVDADSANIQPGNNKGMVEGKRRSNGSRDWLSGSNKMSSISKGNYFKITKKTKRKEKENQKLKPFSISQIQFFRNNSKNNLLVISTKSHHSNIVQNHCVEIQTQRSSGGDSKSSTSTSAYANSNSDLKRSFSEGEIYKRGLLGLPKIDLENTFFKEFLKFCGNKIMPSGLVQLNLGNYPALVLALPNDLGIAKVAPTTGNCPLELKHLSEQRNGEVVMTNEGGLSASREKEENNKRSRNHLPDINEGNRTETPTFTLSTSSNNIAFNSNSHAELRKEDEQVNHNLRIPSSSINYTEVPILKTTQLSVEKQKKGSRKVQRNEHNEGNIGEGKISDFAKCNKYTCTNFQTRKKLKPSEDSKIPNPKGSHVRENLPANDTARRESIELLNTECTTQTPTKLNKAIITVKCAIFKSESDIRTGVKISKEGNLSRNLESPEKKAVLLPKDPENVTSATQKSLKATTTRSAGKVKVPTTRTYHDLERTFYKDTQTSLNATSGSTGKVKVPPTSTYHDLERTFYKDTQTSLNVISGSTGKVKVQPTTTYHDLERTFYKDTTSGEPTDIHLQVGYNTVNFPIGLKNTRSLIRKTEPSKKMEISTSLDSAGCEYTDKKDENKTVVQSTTQTGHEGKKPDSSYGMNSSPKMFKGRSSKELVEFDSNKGNICLAKKQKAEKKSYRRASCSSYLLPYTKKGKCKQGSNTEGGAAQNHKELNQPTVDCERSQETKFVPYNSIYSNRLEYPCGFQRGYGVRRKLNSARIRNMKGTKCKVLASKKKHKKHKNSFCTKPHRSRLVVSYQERLVTSPDHHLNRKKSMKRKKMEKGSTSFGDSIFPFSMRKKRRREVEPYQRPLMSMDCFTVDEPTPRKLNSVPRISNNVSSHFVNESMEREAFENLTTKVLYGERDFEDGNRLPDSFDKYHVRMGLRENQVCEDFISGKREAKALSVVLEEESSSQEDTFEVQPNTFENNEIVCPPIERRKRGGTFAGDGKQPFKVKRQRATEDGTRKIGILRKDGFCDVDIIYNPHKKKRGKIKDVRIAEKRPTSEGCRFSAKSSGEDLRKKTRNVTNRLKDFDTEASFQTHSSKRSSRESTDEFIQDEGVVPKNRCRICLAECSSTFDFCSSCILEIGERLRGKGVSRNGSRRSRIEKKRSKKCSTEDLWLYCQPEVEKSFDKANQKKMPNIDKEDNPNSTCSLCVICRRRAIKRSHKCKFWKSICNKNRLRRNRCKMCSRKVKICNEKTPPTSSLSHQGRKKNPKRAKKSVPEIESSLRCEDTAAASETSFSCSLRAKKRSNKQSKPSNKGSQTKTSFRWNRCRICRKKCPIGYVVCSPCVRGGSRGQCKKKVQYTAEQGKDVPVSRCAICNEVCVSCSANGLTEQRSRKSKKSLQGKESSSKAKRTKRKARKREQVSRRSSKDSINTYTSDQSFAGVDACKSRSSTSLSCCVSSEESSWGSDKVKTTKAPKRKREVTVQAVQVSKDPNERLNVSPQLMTKEKVKKSENKTKTDTTKKEKKTREDCVCKEVPPDEYWCSKCCQLVVPVKVIRRTVMTDCVSYFCSSCIPHLSVHQTLYFCPICNGQAIKK